MTFSIAARCPRTGEFGVAVASSSPAVAARCAHVRAGVGAACSQNVTDPRLGPALLDALAGRPGAEGAVAHVVDGQLQASWRQLTLIGAVGGPAQYSGERTLGRHAHALGEDAVAAGNLLAHEGVPPAMTEAFAGSPDAPLGRRLVDALAAGAAAGGEAGPVHSAGLLVAAQVAWPVTDLRVDWTEGDPVAELDGLWRLWEPQGADYVRRALDPSAAPGYGVPGDPA